MKHSPSSSGDFGLFCRLSDSWTDDVFRTLLIGSWTLALEVGGCLPLTVCLLDATKTYDFCSFVLFCFLNHCLFGSSSSALGWEFCWCEDPVWAAEAEHAQCRLFASALGTTLHFRSLTIIQHQTELPPIKHEWKLKVTNLFLWVESELFPASALLFWRGTAVVGRTYEAEHSIIPELWLIESQSAFYFIQL